MLRLYFTENTRAVEEWVKPFLPESLWSFGNDGVVRGLLSQPAICRCGRATYFVINRDGRTRCVSCDLSYSQGTLTH